jgi:hypothetical protein
MEFMNPYYRHCLRLHYLVFAIALTIFDGKGGSAEAEQFQASRPRGRSLEGNTPHGEKQQRRTSNTGNPKISEPALL